MRGTREPMHRNKPWLVEEEAFEAINVWLRRRPGVFGPRATATECFQEALAALAATGTRCDLSLFKFQIKRIGYAIEKGSGGYRLDLSDPVLMENA